MEHSEELVEAVARLRGWQPIGGDGRLRSELQASKGRFFAYAKASLAAGLLTVLAMSLLATVWREVHFPMGLGLLIILSFFASPALAVMAVLPGLNWLSLKKLSRPPEPDELRRLEP